MAAYLCPLSMFSHGICGVSSFYLMSLPLCVKPGPTCVTPRSFRVALMLPIALIWPGLGTMPSALHWPNTGLLVWDSELSAASPWRVQEASAPPFTPVGGKRPIVPSACGGLLGVTFCFFNARRQTQVQCMMLATGSPTQLHLWAIVFDKGILKPLLGVL